MLGAANLYESHSSVSSHILVFGKRDSLFW